MAIQADDIQDALKMVMHPDEGKDVVSLGMINDLNIGDDTISFTLSPKKENDTALEKLKQDCIDAVKDLVDSDINVEVAIGTFESDNPLDKIDNIIAVASGKGGVGKSMVAANLACALAQTGAKVGLVDTDIYGPSIPTMFGINERPNINTKRKLIPLEKYGVKLVSMGFLVDSDQSVIWRGPMVSSAVKQFINDVEWGELDYLVMDLPPGTGDIQLTIVQNIPITGSIVVSTPQDVALADARKGVAMFNKVNVPVLGIVENMAYFTPPELPDNKYYIFGQGGARKLAEKLEVPFLGEIPIEEKTREAGDKGTPIVVSDESAPSAKALTQLARDAIQILKDRKQNQPPTETVDIKIK